jgi:hypothetical protein
VPLSRRAIEGSQKPELPTRTDGAWVRGCPLSAPASSIRSAPSCWSVALPCGKAFASCAGQMLDATIHWFLRNRAGGQEVGGRRWQPVGIEVYQIVPPLICAPVALHGASITDFAPRHSLVRALQCTGLL